MNKKLVNAVIKQLGYKSDDPELLGVMRDVSRRGTNTGRSGFAYYSETVDFFRKNRTEIIAMVREMAEEFDQSSIELVKSFRCLPDADEDEIGRALYRRIKSTDTEVPNALAWCALEEAAHWYLNEHGQE